MNQKIIAEIASNHQGDRVLAQRFIRVTSECGVDCVKFQSSRYEDLVDKNDSQAAWIQQTSLSDEDHMMLMQTCREHNVQFLTTCFSKSRISFLANLELDEIKIASPDLLSFPMIEECARHFKRLIISTGMHSRKDIKKAIYFLIQNKINATLLHAVSLYPTPFEKSFMGKFLWLQDNYSSVGYSHHCANIEPAMFALARGATIVEVHVKLGDHGPGRMCPWDISPDQLRTLVVFKDTVKTMLGDLEWLQDETFLFPEEGKAHQRFVGRWGNNAS